MSVSSHQRCGIMQTLKPLGTCIKWRQLSSLKKEIVQDLGHLS